MMDGKGGRACRQGQDGSEHLSVGRSPRMVTRSLVYAVAWYGVVPMIEGLRSTGLKVYEDENTIPLQARVICDGKGILGVLLHRLVYR